MYIVQLGKFFISCINSQLLHFSVLTIMFWFDLIIYNSSYRSLTHVIM